MAVFIDVFEDFSDLCNTIRSGQDTDKLNAILETVQQKGTRILMLKFPCVRFLPQKQ